MKTRKLLMVLLMAFCWLSIGWAADEQAPRRRRRDQRVPEEFRNRILAGRARETKEAAVDKPAPPEDRKTGGKARESRAAPVKAAPRIETDAATKARLKKELPDKALAKGAPIMPPADGSAPAAPEGEGAEPAEPPPPPSVRIIPDKDVLYLKNGEKVEGTIIFVGSQLVVFHTSEGERSIEREKIERIQYRRQSTERKTYATKFEGGHIYLTNVEAPETPAAPAELKADKMPAAPAIPRSGSGIMSPGDPQTKLPGDRAARRAGGRGERQRGGRAGGQRGDARGNRPPGGTAGGPSEEKLRDALKGLKVTPEMLKQLKGGKDMPAELQRMLEQMPKKK